MGRGFLAGSLWGLLIGAAVIALTSQLSDYRDLRPPAVADAAPGPADTPESGEGAMVAARDDTPVSDEARETGTLAETEADATPMAPEDPAEPAEVAADAPDAPEAPGSEVADLPETGAEAPPPGTSEAAALSEAPTSDTPVVAEEITRTPPPQVPSDVAELPNAPETGDAPQIAAGTDDALANQALAMVQEPDADTPLTQGLDAPDEPVTAAAPALSTPPKPAPRAEAPETEVAALDRPEADALDTPETSAEAPVVATEPPEETVVEEVVEEPVEPEAPVVVEAEPEPTVEPEAEVVAEETPSEETTPASDETAVAVVEEQPEAAPVAEEPAQDAASSETDVIEIIRRGTQSEDAAAPQTVEVDQPETGAETAEMAPSGEEPSILETDSGTVGNLADNVRVGRLVTIERVSPEEGAAAEAAAAAETASAEIADETAMELPEDALRRHAAVFEAPEDLPVLSVVLIHEGNVSGLDTFPVPVSFAVDASKPSAAQIASGFRSAGREVVLIPNLPARASPGDVEQALQINLGEVPEAVALMDLPSASFQSSRAAIAQVVAAASQTGHGVVTFPRGLNSAQQLADRSGVQAALVFRDLDGDGQPAGAIARALDQAVLRARPGEPVVLVGRTRPETLRAIANWATSSKAANVSLAPVSTALLSQ